MPLSFLMIVMGFVTLETLLTISLVILVIPAGLILALIVHKALDRLCVNYAIRYCEARRLDVQRMRWRPELDLSGVKTAYTLVQLDCFDAQKQRRLISLLVWPLGIRKTIGDMPFPQSLDDPDRESTSERSGES